MTLVMQKQIIKHKSKAENKDTWMGEEIPGNISRLPGGRAGEAPAIKISEIIKRSVGSFLLHGTKELVKTAIFRSREELRIRLWVMAAALQQKPMAMDRHCLLQVRHFRNEESR